MRCCGVMWLPEVVRCPICHTLLEPAIGEQSGASDQSSSAAVRDARNGAPGMVAGGTARYHWDPSQPQPQNDPWRYDPDGPSLPRTGRARLRGNRGWVEAPGVFQQAESPQEAGLTHVSETQAAAAVQSPAAPHAEHSDLRTDGETVTHPPARPDSGSANTGRNPWLNMLTNGGTGGQVRQTGGPDTPRPPMHTAAREQPGGWLAEGFVKNPRPGEEPSWFIARWLRTLFTGVPWVPDNQVLNFQVEEGDGERHIENPTIHGAVIYGRIRRGHLLDGNRVRVWGFRDRHNTIIVRRADNVHTGEHLDLTNSLSAAEAWGITLVVAALLYGVWQLFVSIPWGRIIDFGITVLVYVIVIWFLIWAYFRRR